MRLNNKARAPCYKREPSHNLKVEQRFQTFLVQKRREIEEKVCNEKPG